MTEMEPHPESRLIFYQHRPAYPDNNKLKIGILKSDVFSANMACWGKNVGLPSFAPSWFSLFLRNDDTVTRSIWMFH
jgi:hypothetical protein